jgi:hypothetical protein
VSALPKVMLSTTVAGVGVAAVFSLAVLSAARYADARRAEQYVAAVIYGVLVLVALAACAAAVVYGVLLVGHKS